MFNWIFKNTKVLINNEVLNKFLAKEKSGVRND